MERTIVRCAQGALYSTIWMSFGSLKAVRRGPQRTQRCPVHHTWERVRKVDLQTLTSEQLAQARSVRDLPIP